MDKQNNRSEKYPYLDKGKKSLVLGGVIVLLVAITPYLFYTYESFPEKSKIWETSLFTIKTDNFTSLYVFAWYMINKIIPLYLLLLWFFTCKHWWHWIILVPIAMYVFQTWAIIHQSGNWDEVELIYLIPLMMVIVPIVYVIRAKIFANIHGDDLKTFEEELGQRRTLWQQIKDLFH
jgi:hypothetical protein